MTVNIAKPEHEIAYQEIVALIRRVELLDAIIAYYHSRSWPSYQEIDWFRNMRFTDAMLQEQSAAINRHGERHRNANGQAPLVEQADTSDLKSDAERRGGSNPSGGTTEARRAAIEECAQIVRRRACQYQAYQALPGAIFNAQIVAEDMSRLEQRIRALASPAPQEETR